MVQQVRADDLDDGARSALAHRRKGTGGPDGGGGQFEAVRRGVEAQVGHQGRQKAGRVPEQVLDAHDIEVGMLDGLHGSLVVDPAPGRVPGRPAVGGRGKASRHLAPVPHDVDETGVRVEAGDLVGVADVIGGVLHDPLTTRGLQPGHQRGISQQPGCEQQLLLGGQTRQSLGALVEAPMLENATDALGEDMGRHRRGGDAGKASERPEQPFGARIGCREQEERPAVEGALGGQLRLEVEVRWSHTSVGSRGGTDAGKDPPARTRGPFPGADQPNPSAQPLGWREQPSPSRTTVSALEPVPGPSGEKTGATGVAGAPVSSVS